MAMDVVVQMRLLFVAGLVVLATAILLIALLVNLADTVSSCGRRAGGCCCDAVRKDDGDMMTLVGIAVALTPLLVVVALLRLADSVAARREASIARQVQLTEAIHRELGAAAAPVVRHPLWGGWLVSMAVPLDRPGTVAALLRITHRAFASTEHEAPVQIVLTPSAGPAEPRARPPYRAGRRPAAPLAPAFR
jgi:hypothetical protein